MRFFLFLVIGVVAGWLAGRLIKDKRMSDKRFGRYGILGVGVLGALVGGVAYAIFDSAGIVPTGSLIGAMMMASAGAAGLLWGAARMKPA